MPNWTNNTIIISGKNEGILRFLNEGLRNSKIEPLSDIQNAYNMLIENGKHKSIEDERKLNKDIILERGVMMRTFRPIPDTYLLYDTTNDMPKRDSWAWGGGHVFHSDEEYEEYKTAYENAVKEQEEKYGARGWYDYNLLTLSVKWDAALCEWELYTSGDNASIVFRCETPWSYPNNWLRWIKDTFNVNVFILAFEECSSFNFYKEIDGEEVNIDFDAIDGCPKKENYPQDSEGEESYYNDYWEFITLAKSKIEEEFRAYVNGYPSSPYE